MTFRLHITYCAAQARTRSEGRAVRIGFRPSVRADPSPHTDAPAPLMAPASMLDHRERQHARLRRAADHLWRRDEGRHQRDIAALLALHEAGDISTRDAHARLADLDRRTARAA